MRQRRSRKIRLRANLTLVTRFHHRLRLRATYPSRPFASTPIPHPVRRRRAWCGCPAEPSGWAVRGAACPTRCRHISLTVDGFWMDRTPVTNADFQKFVAATNYVTVAERPLDPREVSRCTERDARAGVGGVQADMRNPFGSTIPAVVALHAGRKLETSGRSGQLDSRSRRSSCRARRVRGCVGIRKVGRQAAANRSRVRVRRARRARSQLVSVGQHADARRQARRQYLAGAVSCARPRRRWLRGHVAGDGVSRQCVRTV